MKLKLYFSAAFFGLVALTSCDGKKDCPYEPADPVAPGQRVYFAKSSEDFEVRDNSASVSVDIYRPEAEIATAQTVELEVDDPSGLFNVPATVTIPAGQVSAPIEITYDWKALVEDEPYNVELSLSEIFANQYSISSTDLTITRSNWNAWELFPGKSKGIGAYIFADYYSGLEEPVRLICRSNVNDAKRIQYELQWLEDPKDKTSWGSFMSFVTNDSGKTFIVPVQEFDEYPGYGTVYVSSTSLYPYADELVTPEEAAAPSTFDEETGLFTFNLAYYVSIGAFGIGNEYFQLNGYDEVTGNVPEPTQMRKLSRSALKPARALTTLKH